MKKLDVKSLIIGVLATVLVFVLIGAKIQNENLGDITVNSIKVVDKDGKKTVFLGIPTPEGIGRLAIFDEHGELSVALGVLEYGGILTTYNKHGKPTVALGTDLGGSGILETYNEHEKKIVYLGTGKEGHGCIALFDKYGDLGWIKSGKN